MSPIAREYGPEECDEQGVPLDYERCRTCYGGERLHWGHPAFMGTCCRTCGGHGSLKAAALSALVYPPMSGPRYDPAEHGHAPIKVDLSKVPPRCEGCEHPMSEGAWDPPQGSPGWGPPEPVKHASYLAAVERWLREGGPDPLWAWVHFSRCDEKCDHPVWPPRDRVTNKTDRATSFIDDGTGSVQVRLDAGMTVEAFWRPVDLRLLDFPNDLRPESLAVLCLRCWAASA